MTTIILTIIGILLAALAALMIIFYGGSAFNAGSVKAQANTLQNAGTNVISAYDLDLANGNTPLSVADLKTDNALKTDPALPGSLTGAFDSATAPQYYQVANVGTDVCAAVETNLGNTATNDTAIGDRKMGCVGGTFYAAL